MQLSRTLARDGKSLRPSTKASYLTQIRLDRCGAHVWSARKYRRRAQLGLSLRVDSRFSFYRLLSAATGLHGRGGSVYEMDSCPLHRPLRGPWQRTIKDSLSLGWKLRLKRRSLEPS